MNRIMRMLGFLLLFPVSLTYVSSEEILSKAVKDSVATFADVAQMLFRSFDPVGIVKNKKRQDKFKENASTAKPKVDMTAIYRELRERGLEIPAASQPISKQFFSQILFKRFQKLPTSFLTKTLRFSSLYFKDAQKLHIFRNSEQPKETLTIKGMMTAYYRVQKILTTNRIK